MRVLVVALQLWCAYVFAAFPGCCAHTDVCIARWRCVDVAMQRRMHGCACVLCSVSAKESLSRHMLTERVHLWQGVELSCVCADEGVLSYPELVLPSSCVFS